MISPIPCSCGKEKTWYATVCKDCYWAKIRSVTNEERFWKRVNKTDTCWLWTGSKHEYGYGNFHMHLGEYEYRNINAHRFAWELLVGPVPDGMVLDHKVCNNPPCCNPAHLVVTTNWDNISRSGKSPSIINKLKTHCKRGHEFTPENTYIPPGKPCRMCKICMTEVRRQRTGAKPRNFKVPRCERTENEEVFRV